MSSAIPSTYVCPATRQPLFETDAGLERSDGRRYPFVTGCNDVRIPDFVESNKLGEAGKQSLEMYNQAASVQIYKNFLGWLFETFNEDQASFRKGLLERAGIKPGDRVLVTGCGLGDDIPPLLEVMRSQGEVYAQDLSAEMVLGASCEVMPSHADATIKLSISNASQLPFADRFFDAAYHFGGINLFDDIKLAIHEMERVVKIGGRVVFGDEGVAPWLRQTAYGRMAINNNKLWQSESPIALLPEKVVDVELSWVLGNCFYVISFEVSDSGPYMNPDVPHKGPRGGSMRTRYQEILDKSS